jgi:hypothetical protein
LTLAIDLLLYLIMMTSFLLRCISVSAQQCCGSGSGRIGVILADPDRNLGPADPEPDPYQKKLSNTFSRKFPNTVQNIDTNDADVNDKKQSELA